MENILFNFLPKFIEDKYNKGIKHGSFSGSALFLDITNFTAKTEILFKKGDQGAEEISNLLKRTFDIPIKSVYSNNGFIANFAGDAFLAVFPEDNFERCKRTIEVIYSNIKKDDLEYNSFKLGSGTGEISWGIVGNKNFKSYYFSGSAVENAVNTTHQIKKEDFLKNKDSFELTDFKTRIQSSQILKVFTDHSILKGTGKAELRYAIPVFAQFGKLKSYTSINKIASNCIFYSQQFKGTFNKIDVSDKGIVILTVFGAPETRENSEISAIRYAISVRKKFKNVKIGLDYGLVYSGLTGNNFRNEWTVIGDIVNTSARLMMKAEQGEIIVSNNFKEKSEHFFKYNSKDFIKLKGKTKEEKIYKFLDFKHQLQTKYISSFVGRNNELEKLEQYIEHSISSSHPSLIHINGEAGIGKTRLVDESIKKICTDKYNWIKVKCDQTLPFPWNPFQFSLKEIFNIKEDNKEEIKEKIISYLESISPILRAYWSYIAAMIGYRWKNTPYEHVDEKKRVENQMYIFNQLLFHFSKAKPFILIVDDFQWIDELSSYWMSEFINSKKTYSSDRNISYVIIVISRQTNLNIKLSDDVNLNYIHLQTLHHDEIDGLIKSILGYKTYQHLEESIIDKVQGNPFFAEQLSLSIKEKSDDTDAQIDRLPSSLSEILTARIDSLEFNTRELLKNASSIGQTFSNDLINNLSTKNNIYFENALFDAINKGVIIRKEQNTFSFSHNLLQEAAYQLLLPSDRIKLHVNVVEILESEEEQILEKNLGLLYLQTKKAGLTQKWILYAEKYALLLKESYANRDAFKIYTELSDYYIKNNIIEKYLKMSIQIGLIQILIGENTKAKIILTEALEKAEDNNNSDLEVLISLKLGDVYSRLGENEKAENLIQLAYNQSQKTNYIEGRIESLNALGIINRKKGQYDESIKNYKTALELTKKSDNVEKELRTLINLGALYNSLGEYDIAENYMNQCFVDRKIEKHKVLQAGLYNNLGIIQIRKGKYKEALDYFKNSVNVKEEIGDIPGLASTKHNIGVIYIDLGDKELAEKYLTESVEINKATGMKFEQMQSLTNLGALYEENLSKALEYYNEALSLAEKFKFIKQNMEILFNIGEAYKIANEDKKSCHYYNKSLEIAKELKDDQMEKLINEHLNQLTMSN